MDPSDLRWLIAMSIFLSSCAIAQGAQPAIKSPVKSLSAPSRAAAAQPVPAWKQAAGELLKQANEKTQSGEVGPARSLVEQAVATVKENAGEQDLLMADCLLADGRIQALERNMGLAEESIKQAVDIRRKLLKPEAGLLIDALQEYASLLDKMGRKSEGDKIREEVALTHAKERVSAVVRPANGTAVGDSAAAAILLARQTAEKGDREAALAQWKLALAAAQKQDSAGLRTAYCFIKLGDEYLYKKDYTQALHNLKFAIDALKPAHQDSYCALIAFRRIGMIEATNKNFVQAIDSFAKSVDIATRTHADPRLTASTLQQLISMCIMNKDLGKGEQACKQLMELSDQLTGAMKASSKMTASSMLGSIYMQTGRMNEGMTLMKQLSGSQPANSQEYSQQLMADYTAMEKLADDAMLKEVSVKQ
ncbi:MAG: hypothetical protein K2W95_20430 [Candidatus Obscuribacterales bacterium]|nr:hypothetical protein [Candidatus Obscuribacterales bacterium]